MTKLLQQIYAALKNGILLYFAAIGIFFTFQYLSFYFSDVTDYIEYYSVEPVKQVYAIGEDLQFKSDHKINKVSNIVWTDIIRCKTILQTDYTYFSSYISTSKATPKSDRKITTWRYGSETPQEKSKCVLDSTQTVILPFNIEKQNKTLSNPFMIE